MTKIGIFSFSLGLALGLAAGLALAQGQPSEVALKAKKPPHEQAIRAIEQERLIFQRELSVREQDCFKRFFSARCLNQVTTDHLREMRNFDLRREAELQALRDIDAQLRAIRRDRKVSNSDATSF